jgi:hypothetical protein
MIVVIVILAIVSAITIKFLVDGMRIYTMTVNQKTLYDEGKLALERMCRDIRDAQSITSPTPGNQANAISFTRTYATAQDIANEGITFNLSGSNLQKVKASPATTATMASNVTPFTVTCGVPPTVNTNYMITLYLTLSLTSGENVTLQTIVYPKNLNRDGTRTYKNFFRNWQEVYQ